jgi:hypothetical protein
LAEDREKRLRARPPLNVDLARIDLFRGIGDSVEVCAPPAETALAMWGNLEAKRACSQMSYLAEKIDWRFRIAILKFSIRRAHAAERLDLAIHAF